MGGTNSCMFATAVSLSLFLHVKDKLIFRPAYLPKPLPKKLTLPLPSKPMTTEESYGMQPPLGQPACALFRRVIDREIFQAREKSPNHFLPIEEKQRARLEATSKKSLLQVTTLIDDNAIASRPHECFQQLPEKEQTTIHLNIHLLAIKQLFLTMIQSSPAPSQETPCPSPIKLKLEKSVFLANHCRFLNTVYLDNFQVIQLESYKRTYDSLEKPPATGDQLRSVLSFLTYFLNFIPRLRFLAQPLETFARKHPGAQKLIWTPHLAKQYRTLAKSAKIISGLKALPDDLSQLERIVISSDACSSTIAFNIGLVLKSEDSSNKATTHSTLHLYRNYSAYLPEHFKNAPVVLKESLACTRSIDLESDFLLLTKPVPKYFAIDNSNLFSFLNRLQETNRLATHFGSHPLIQVCILRLFEALHAYNGTLIQVKSSQCMADVLTRMAPNTETKAKCSSTTKKIPCSPCQGCNLTCQRVNPHKDCQFNIRNTECPEGPKLINYDDISKRTITTDRETIKFSVATVSMDPAQWEIIDLHPLVAEIPLASPTSLHFPDEDTLQANWILTSPNQTQDEIEEEASQITENLRELTSHGAVAAVHPIKRTTFLAEHEANIFKHKGFWIPFPNLTTMFSTTKGTVEEKGLTTILLFVTQNKSAWNRQTSIYMEQLHETSAPRLDLKTNSTTVIYHQNKTYLIMCTDNNLLQPQQEFIPQVRALMKLARQQFTNTHLIVDQNSISKLFNITPQTTQLVVALIAGHFIHEFRTICIHSFGKPVCIQSLSKPSNIEPQEISRQLPITHMGTRIAVIKLDLDKIGECHELEHQVRRAVPVEFKDNNIRLKYQTGTFPVSSKSNLTTVKEIMVQQPLYIASIVNDPDDPEDPIHADLIGAMKLRINQGHDPTLSAIRTKAEAAEEHGGTVTSPCKSVEIKSEDNILWGRHVNDPSSNAYKPILPENMYLTEILHAHNSLGCANVTATVHHILENFFHKQGVTSAHSLMEIAKTLIPCPRCLIKKPSHLKGGILYTQTRNVLTSMALSAPCLLWAHDVFYLQKVPQPNLQNPYVSLFVCYSCGMIDAKPIPVVNGEQLATHFLAFAQMSGGTCAVLLSDTASTEIRGPLAACLRDINVLSNQANFKILAQDTSQPIHPIQNTLPRGPEHDLNANDDINQDPPNFPSDLLDHLTPQHKNMLLSDFITSQPPLHHRILTHSPPPSHQFRTGRNTSLGRLDKQCLYLAAYIRRYIGKYETSDEQDMDSQMTLLIQSYVYLNNFLLKDPQSGQEPALIHLGILKTKNLNTFYNKITQPEVPIASKEIRQLQQLLALARQHLQAEKTRDLRNAKAERAHLRQHKTLLSDQQFQLQFQPLTLLFLRIEEVQKKTDATPFYTGPYIVVANILQSRVLYLYELLTGKIYKRSYRSVEKLMTNKEIPSLPIDILRTWMDYHPRQILHKHCKSQTQTKEQAQATFKIILQNMDKLYRFLRPALPSAQETLRTIELYDQSEERDREARANADPGMQDAQDAPLQTADDLAPKPAETRVSFQLKHPQAQDEIIDMIKKPEPPPKPKTVQGPQQSYTLPTPEKAAPQGPQPVKAPDPPNLQPPVNQGTRRSSRIPTRRQDPNFIYH